jgi:pilus assembly protein Flp/PilA
MTYMNALKTLGGNEDGATAIEYGLIAGLIAVAIITAVTLVGTNLTTGFNGVAGKISANMPAPAA